MNFEQGRRQSGYAWQDRKSRLGSRFTAVRTSIASRWFPSRPAPVAGWLWEVLALSCIAYWHVQTVSALPKLLQLDSTNVYLPGARSLIEQGWAFFSTPESYHTAPLNFIWPALFSGELETIVTANLCLSVLILALVFYTGKLLCNRLAGLAGALLYAASPLIPPLFTSVLSEPLFLAGTMTWIFGTAHYVLRRPVGLYIAVIGGCVTILTRPIWLPFILVSIPLLAWKWRTRRSEDAWRKLLLVHGCILVAGALYGLHNQLEFGFFGIATGGGTALYLGNHPLTHGIEPGRLMLDYDVQTTLIPWNGEHLSIEGDRVLRAIGWSMIWDRSFIEQIQWLLYKIGAVLFFVKGDFAPDLYSIRALRVFECLFAIYGTGFVRSDALRTWIAGAITIQVAQLAMLLYNLRYSIGSLELWLILLAGCGVARLLDGVRARIWSVPSGVRLGIDFEKSAHSGWPGIAVVILVVAGIGIAHWDRRLSPSLQPGVDRAPVRALLELEAPKANASQSRNVVRLPNGAFFVGGNEGLMAFDVPGPPHHELGFNQIWLLELTIVPPPGETCRGGRISYESIEPRPDVPFTALPIEFKGDGLVHRYAISATYPFSALYPASAGILRLRPFCPMNTHVAVHRISLLESTAHTFYQSRVKLP
jgi:hypothetical protein